jgi:putative SOS response-associated peptidase YedK
MCGRFTLMVNPAEAQETFTEYTFPERFAPRFNIAPTQPVLVIPNDDQNTADFFIWGLIPMWAKDPSIGSRLINARGETLEEKPAFRGSLKHKRCLILADGFYEWKGAPGRKTKNPFFIHMKDRKPFAFAGLWDSWNGPDGSQVKSCAIITTLPNELITIIHNRMPAILHPRDYAKWLDPSSQTPDQLKPLIKPFPAEMMNAYPVSTLVNTPSNDTPELILPVK